VQATLEPGMRVLDLGPSTTSAPAPTTSATSPSSCDLEARSLPGSVRRLPSSSRRTSRRAGDRTCAPGSHLTGGTNSGNAQTWSASKPADFLPNSWSDWLLWLKTFAEVGRGYEPDEQMLEADQGNLLGLTRLVAQLN
jgi:hypothetical protein